MTILILYLSAPYAMEQDTTPDGVVKSPICEASALGVQALVIATFSLAI